MISLRITDFIEEYKKKNRDACRKILYKLRREEGLNEVIIRTLLVKEAVKKLVLNRQEKVRFEHDVSEYLKEIGDD